MEKVFDMHVHYTIEEMPIEEAIRIFRIEFAATGVERETFLSVPNYGGHSEFVPPNAFNLRMLFLKHALWPTAYAYAGLEHPADVAQWDDDALSALYLKQAEEYHAAGFDGIKMLEGYPSFRKIMKRSLCSPVYDPFYSFLEENGIPVTMHIANPAENWDPAKVPERAVKAGRAYDGTYPTKAQLHEEVEGIMKKHPRLKLTLAHLGFLSYDIGQARRWLDAYENTAFDLTPGYEQLLTVLKDWDQWQSFFEAYQDRIFYGTDTYSLPQNDRWEERVMCRPRFLRQIFETDTEHTFRGETFRGIQLDPKIRQKIYYDNGMKLLGQPRKVDLLYLKNKAGQLLRSGIYTDEITLHDLNYIIEAL